MDGIEATLAMHPGTGSWAKQAFDDGNRVYALPRYGLTLTGAGDEWQVSVDPRSCPTVDTEVEHDVMDGATCADVGLLLSLVEGVAENVKTAIRASAASGVLAGGKVGNLEALFDAMPDSIDIRAWFEKPAAHARMSRPARRYLGPGAAGEISSRG